MINKSKLINLSLLLMIFIAFSCNKDDDFEPETENIEQQEVFQEFWDIYDRYYPLFPRKNIDWQVVYNTYSPQVTETTTDEELFDIFEEIITTILKDGHSFVSYNNGEREAVYGLGNSEELQNTLFDNTPSKVNIVPSSANNPYISYGTLVDEPDIGFIHTKSFEPVVQDDAEFDNFKAIVDEALAALQSKESDNGKFKVPSLKNISMRPPYMHDGRFGTLEEVIEHYSSGIQNHPNLISPLVNSNGEVGQFNFTQEEKEALIAFLNTLTDNEMLADEKYSNPFE